MRLPHLRRLVAGLFEPQLISKLLCLEALHGPNGSQLSQLLVKPEFADLQRRKVPIPAAFSLVRRGLDVFYSEDAHGKELTEPAHQPEFPLPTGFGGRWDLILAVLAVLALLPMRGVASSAREAHLRALLLGFLDSCAGIGLDIEIGMRC